MAEHSIFLSRLALDPHRRDVWRAAADVHTLHRAVLAAFPDGAEAAARETFAVLHHLEVGTTTPAPTLLVQSTVAPDWSRPGSAGAWTAAIPPAIKEVQASYQAIAAGDRLRFRLRANPTKRVHILRAGEDTLAGKRVDLRDERDRLAWLNRKGAQHGFRVVAADVRPGTAGRTEHGRQGSSRLSFGAAIFDGVLEVVDAAAFQEALRSGIGSGKAFGFGLLSVAPVR